MRIEVSEQDGIQVVRIHGNLDSASSNDFESELNSLLDRGASRLIIDLEKVSYTTSSGLRVLLATAKKLRQTSGELVVSNLSPVVTDVFEVSGLSTLFRIFPTADQAIEEF